LGVITQNLRPKKWEWVITEAMDLDPIEARPVGIVVGHDRTDEDLQQEKCCDHEKILADPPLARGHGL
jgi:hypothetical protein